MTELAAGKDFREQYQSSRLHLNALKELMAAFGGIECLSNTPKVQLLTCYVLNGCTASYFPAMQLSRPTFHALQHQFKTGQCLFKIDLSPQQQKALIDLQDHVKEFVGLMKSITNPASTSTLALARKTLLPHYFSPQNKMLCDLSVSVLDTHHLGGLGPRGHHRIS